MVHAARASLIAVVRVLAADFEDRIPADHTAAIPVGGARVRDRTWQKRATWLRERKWLRHGSGGQWDGWHLIAGTSMMTTLVSET